MVHLQTIEMFSCLMMTGIIWIIQIVHYPSFNFISRDAFISFELFHQKKISILVVPLMLCEFICHVISLFFGVFSISLSEVFSSLALFGIWFVTFFMCVPCHNKLCRVFDATVIKNLIFYNWFRTILWTMRSFLFFLYQTTNI